MSIKKCIMNYFDKATNAMIPFHPQTESGAITDWHESVIKSLASKVLPTVVSELTTDSVMGKLMKMLLNASGVKYSIDTNGYVCLGSFFGGLIIQWVSLNVSANINSGSAPWPIAFNKALKQIGSRNAKQATQLWEAYAASLTIVSVHLNAESSGQLTYSVIGIGV